MPESFGDEFRNKQKLNSENIDKEKLDEIVQAAKNEVNEDQEQETYLSHGSRRLPFKIPKLSDTQLAYIAKKLDMHVNQLTNNSIAIICDKKPELSEYLDLGTKVMLFSGPQLVAIGVLVIIGLIFGTKGNFVIPVGLITIFTGLFTGLDLTFTNNELVNIAINTQIENEILNK